MIHPLVLTIQEMQSRKIQATRRVACYVLVGRDEGTIAFVGAKGWDIRENSKWLHPSLLGRASLGEVLGYRKSQ